MKKYKITDNLFKDALIEIKNLKKHATKKELQKLDFNNLKPAQPNSCIYGQMTSSCFSNRAHALISKCIPTENSMYYGTDIDSEKFRNTLSFTDRQHQHSVFVNKTYSALEAVIVSYPENNKNIIAFLKSERKTLTKLIADPNFIPNFIEFYT